MPSASLHGSASLINQPPRVIDGVLQCTRYAFGPNRLHYCGPDASGEIYTHMNEGISNPALQNLLSKFQTMYPYLRKIAHANKIRDPFDRRVVEAYWLGNKLLERLDRQTLYDHFIDDHNLKKRMTARSFSQLADKIGEGALAHHSFHVFNIWKRTGHTEEEHTIESLDACRISWGKVMEVSGPNITVETEPLIFVGHKLALGEPIRKTIIRHLEADADISEVEEGNILSMHWHVPCEIISPQQAKSLRHYTLRSIGLANLTL